MKKRLKLFIKTYFMGRKSYLFFIRDWIALKDLKQASDMMATMRFSRNLIPQLSNGPKAKRLLVIAPHPDDESMGPGGTLLREIDRGADVLVLYLTRGDAASAKEREQESDFISKKYFYSTVSLGYDAKKIQVNDALLIKLGGILNRFNPDVLFIPFCLDDHDDHRLASQLLLLAYEKKLIKTSFTVWAYQVYTVLIPNIIVDITEYAQKKSEMISLWKSQNKKRNWAHYTLGINAFNQRFLAASSAERYAETFFVLPLSEYLSYCKIYFNDSFSSYYSHNLDKKVI